MGQYYRPIVFKNNDQKGRFAIFDLEPCASLNAYNFDNGSKLMEHSWVGNSFVNAVTLLLADDVEDNYSGMNFAWMGDYAEDEGRGFYDKAEEFLTETYFEARKLRLMKGKRKWSTVNYRYVLNYTTMQYVEVPKSAKGQWVIHPLPLLTAVGNGMGLGDYEGTDMDWVGKWAYCEIACTNTKPDDTLWERIEPHFEEKRG